MIMHFPCISMCFWESGRMLYLTFGGGAVAIWSPWSDSGASGAFKAPPAKHRQRMENSWEDSEKMIETADENPQLSF